MSDFDALLTRSFAEAHEPQDDGFAVNVAHKVARSEKALQLRNAFQTGSVVIGSAAAAYGAYAFLGAFGQEFLATLGLEVARIHGSLSAAPVGDVAGEAAGQAQTVMAQLGAGLTQVLLLASVVAGGAVALRSTQQD